MIESPVARRSRHPKYLGANSKLLLIRANSLTRRSIPMTSGARPCERVLRLLPEKVRQYVVMGVDGQRCIWITRLAIPFFSQESAGRRGPQSYGPTRLSPAP
jgi:hypothetical protein